MSKSMKLGNILTVIVLLCATTAFCTVYTDCSTNYTFGSEYNGLNGGEGFGPWTVTQSSAGGWAGTGIWSTTNAGITGWTQAFGMVARGNGSYVHSDRNLRAPLQTNDSLEFDMGVNWDPDKDEGNEEKGFVIFADTNELVTVNHLKDGAISMNGFTNASTLIDYGTIPMHWTFSSVDATTLLVSATSRADTNDVFTTNLTVVSSAVSAFRLQSANNATDDVAERQTYFDNFIFTYDGVLPEVHTLTLAEASGTWAITNATETTLTFNVTRDTSEGDVDVMIYSTDTNFALPSSVSISMLDGVTSTTFTVAAQIYGNDNFSAVSIAATGYDAPSAWELRGPGYTYSIESNLYQIGVSDLVNFWINSPAYAHPFDNDLITATVTDTNVVSVSALNAWADTGEGGQYTSGIITGLAGGQSTLQISYDGVLLHSYTFTVISPYLTINGPDSFRVGETAEYTVSAYDMGNTASVYMSDTNIATVSTDTIDLSGGATTNVVTVSAEAAGSVNLIVSNENGSASFTILVKNSTTNCVAYDDAANASYDAGFVTNPTAIGTSGFGDWSLITTNGTSAGVNIITSVPHANYTNILEDGKAFGAYAYGGENAQIDFYRPFPADLGAGQEFSMDIGSYYRDGSKYFRVVRMYEGAPYNRFEFYASGDYYGITIDGIEGSIDPGWAWDEARLITFKVRRANDGNSYDLTLLSNNGDSWSTNIATSVGSWGDGLQGVLVGVYNGGDVETSPENYSFFNRMAIDQVGTPVVINQPEIGAASITRLDEGMCLSLPIINATIGATYSVEQTTNLVTDPIIWSLVDGASVVADATNITLSVTNATDTQSFFRIGGSN